MKLLLLLISLLSFLYTTAQSIPTQKHTNSEIENSEIRVSANIIFSTEKIRQELPKSIQENDTKLIIRINPDEAVTIFPIIEFNTKQNEEKE